MRSSHSSVFDSIASAGVTPVSLHNVQAPVVHRLRRPIARHLLYQFAAGTAARGFLAELTPRVTMSDPAPDTMADPLFAVGLTFNGLAALGVDPALLATFDAVYKAGPDGVALGDQAGSRSDPANWWEGRFKTDDVHCVVQVHAGTDAAIEDGSRIVRALARRNGVAELIPRRDGSVLESRSLGGGRLHFGYTDGISSVEVRWTDRAGRPGEVDFRNFVLGYATPEHSSAPNAGPAADLVRDSFYGAFRWIYQDVAAFNGFLREEAPRLFPGLAAPDAEELLAAKLMGRWRDGSPLVLAPDRPERRFAASDDFGYATQDPLGQRCPFSAHIRVVNPRDQALDPIQVDGVPRVLRRGLPYGPPLDGIQDDGIDRGLIGLFLCADLRRQIYTLTGWIKQNDFSPVFDTAGHRRTQDPLFGNRHVPGVTTDFTIPGAGDAQTVTGLPDFIHTKGTLFLLYPSRSMLASLAAEPATGGMTS